MAKWKRCGLQNRDARVRFPLPPPIVLPFEWYTVIKYHSRKYKLNEYFFQKWSANMAYVLGFWFADGYMRIEKSYRIVFVSNDKEILEKIRFCFSSTSPIMKDRENCWKITFHSKKIYQDLSKLGGIRCKSRIIEFPKVPKRFLRDFIRGYFDGDGSVFFVQYNRTKDGQQTRELRTNFTSGSKNFLVELMNILHEEVGLPYKKLGYFNDGRSIKLGYGMKDSDSLLRYMYYDKFNIGLDRKSKFVEKIPLYQKHTFK